VVGEQEERRGGAGALLVVQDPVEAPVRIRSAGPVQRGAGEPAQFADAGAQASPAQIALGARGRAFEACARPLPRRVDIVGERDGEPRTSPAGRIDAQATAQALERRIERVEGGGGRPEPVVLVARAVSLLDAGEMEERLG
jgi:hypothetical protein